MKPARHLRFAVAALLGMLLTQPLSAAGKIPPSSDVPPGKSYTYKQSGGQPQELEIYFPPNHDPAKAKVPGVILFHGGAWVAGNLSQFRFACHYFASRGLVAATVNYRMLTRADAKKLPSEESLKRVCISDAKSAIRWFKQHASELGIDPARIITGGGSAGGHLAVLATTNPGLNDPADPQDIDTSVAAYLLFNPAFSADDSRDPEVDVLRHLSRLVAPSVVFFGDQDGWKKGWDAAFAKSKTLGITAPDVQVAKGQSHGFFNKSPWREVTLIAADRFLVNQGVLQGTPSLPSPETGETLVPEPAPPGHP